MKETNCDVIRDLLPLYEDNAVSEETAKLVREHLKDCPDCREELRKMRAPISLPPEEDEELWKKFAEKRERLRKKRNFKIACAVSVLAAAALLCLWYIRPRSWEKLTGPASQEVTSLSGSLMAYYFHTDNEGSVDHGWDVWTMQADQSEGSAAQAIVEALQSYSYRKSLKSLIPRDTWEIDTAPNFVQVGIVWDNTRITSFEVYSNGQMFLDSGLYYTNGELYDRLASILQAYGTFQEDETKSYFTY